MISPPVAKLEFQHADTPSQHTIYFASSSSVFRSAIMLALFLSAQNYASIMYTYPTLVRAHFFHAPPYNTSE